jgi:hypothetical protein
MLDSGWEIRKVGLPQGLRHGYRDWPQSCRTATLLSGVDIRQINGEFGDLAE